MHLREERRKSDNVSGKNIFQIVLPGQYAVRTALFLMLISVATFYGNPIAAGENPDQVTFQSPKDAFEALSEACGANDEQRLLDILGHENKDLVILEDKTQARENRKIFFDRYHEFARIVMENSDKAVLQIGALAWPVPLPVVRENNRWRFDTQAGREEIINRRIGRNELAAIETCRAYVEAQEVYASEDRDEDEVLEYAQKLVSSPGKKDGLFWEEEQEEEMSPLGSFIAGERGYFADKGQDENVWGYRFRIITRQGENVPGGKYEYVINGNMIAGYALVAFPTQYGESGIITFMVNQQGKVYEKDLGEMDKQKYEAITEYNPDDTWQPVMEE